ncbi:hypothetical protein [Natronobacterium texcoconense]|uniref:hypothetical protein n=1 Tax=Natronobacterium texcoconense TaxID=1095778 RepID=UPI000B84C596|nr:hypothetical protein [Natronobacterium texcoconense]
MPRAVGRWPRVERFHIPVFRHHGYTTTGDRRTRPDEIDDRLAELEVSCGDETLELAVDEELTVLDRTRR